MLSFNWYSIEQLKRKQDENDELQFQIHDHLQKQKDYVSLIEDLQNYTRRLNNKVNRYKNKLSSVTHQKDSLSKELELWKSNSNKNLTNISNYSVFVGDSSFQESLDDQPQLINNRRRKILQKFKQQKRELVLLRQVRSFFRILRW